MKDTSSLKNVNIISRDKYNTLAEPGEDELWCIGVENYSDGVNWCRVYPDGWCEQGGTYGAAYTSYVNRTCTFLKPFIDTNYFAVTMSSHTGDLEYPSLYSKTTTSVSFRATYNYGGYSNWYACGYIAL